MCGLPAVFLAAMVGCAPQWHYAYDESIRQARREDRDLLVFYKDPLDVRSSRMRDILQSAEILPLTEVMVRCLLVPSYAPNRSFVAQYGVQQTPAIVVVHPDGTYHKLTGVRSAQEVRVFLDSAKAPGIKPNPNPRIPRGVTFDYFNIYKRALAKAQRQNRRLVIIYKWWLNPDSTELIRRLSRPDVARYFADSVNCILDWDYVPNRSYVRQYGASSFPAIIIVEPDGKYRSLTGLPSVDRIIRFAVSHHSVNGPSDSKNGKASTPPVVWFSDYAAANLVAQRTNRNLLLFYHSEASAVSGAVARLLDQPELRALLATVVNCRLDWSHRSARDRMARFGVTSVPACVLVHRDASFEVLRGQITADELRGLILGTPRQSPSAAKP